MKEACYQTGKETNQLKHASKGHVLSALNNYNKKIFIQCSDCCSI